MRSIIYFIDLDHTLFDTERLIADRWRAASHFGIAEEAWKRAHEEATECGYTPEGHLNALIREGALTEREANEFRQHFADQQSTMSQYVFADVVPFLQRLADANIRSVLVSWGHPVWQELKMRSSGLHPLFSDMQFVSGSGTKHRVIGAQADGAPFAFLDDNAEELDLVKERFPEARTIHVCRYPSGDGGYRGALRHVAYMPRHEHLKLTDLTDLP